MATYLELFSMQSDSDLRDRCTVAVIKAAQERLVADPPVQADVEWATAVLAAPAANGNKALQLVVAANSGATPAQITGASDEQLQTNVDAAIAGLIVANSTGA